MNPRVHAAADETGPAAATETVPTHHTASRGSTLEHAAVAAPLALRANSGFTGLGQKRAGEGLGMRYEQHSAGEGLGD